MTIPAVTTSADNISIVLSGGQSNTNPDKSLGGEPSPHQIVDSSLNNLFNDVSTDQSTVGIEDYRCIYFFNDGETSIWNLKLWLNQGTASGADVEIGFENRNEIQRIIISNNVSGGYLDLSYEEYTFKSYYNANIGLWAESLQSDMMNLTKTGNEDYFFKNLTVTGTQSSNSIIFDVKWQGKDANRNFAKFIVKTSPTDGNQLTTVVDENDVLGLVDVSITVLSEGSPINTIANEIGVSTTPPGAIYFLSHIESDPLVLPRLDPTETFPLWIKRTILSGTTAKEGDNFVLLMSAESLESA
jgi:hypothetical protein